MPEKTILVTSFGTTYTDTREKTIDACEDRMAEQFPDYRIRRSFTSHIIIRRLRERDGMEVPTTEEALEVLAQEGCGEVVIQPLHFIPGAEFHEKIMRSAVSFRGRFEKLVMGRTLLFHEKDYTEVIRALMMRMPELDEGSAAVLMGHGTSHPSNACYSCLQTFLYDEGLPVFVGNVEGYPKLNTIIMRLKARRIRRVHLMPFMLVAGEHARKDMAGGGENSWESILRREGFEVEVHMQGLGENPEIQRLYARRAADAISGVYSCL